MTEKRKASYSLDAIKAAFATPDSLNRTFSAAEGASDLGMDDAAVVAVVQQLSKSDFDKSMTSYADRKVWQDVYKPKIDDRQIYVKFTVDAEQRLLLISFKEA